MEKQQQNHEDELKTQQQNVVDVSADASRKEKDHKKGGIHCNALFASKMWRSTTAHVDPFKAHSKFEG